MLINKEDTKAVWFKIQLYFESKQRKETLGFAKHNGEYHQLISWKIGFLSFDVFIPANSKIVAGRSFWSSTQETSIIYMAYYWTIGELNYTHSNTSMKSISAAAMAANKVLSFCLDSKFLLKKKSSSQNEDPCQVNSSFWYLEPHLTCAISVKWRLEVCNIPNNSFFNLCFNKML